MGFRHFLKNKFNNRHGVYALLIISICVLTIRIYYAYLGASITPIANSRYPVKVLVDSDKSVGGISDVMILDTESEIAFSFNIKENQDNTYASATLEFQDTHPPDQWVNLAQYSYVSFEAQCQPATQLRFYINVFDKNITRTNLPITYRIPTSQFLCPEQKAAVRIPLDTLYIPRWWLVTHNLNSQNADFDLKNAMGLGFFASTFSTVDLDVNVTIEKLSFHPKGWSKLLPVVCALAGLWCAFALWVYRSKFIPLFKTVKKPELSKKAPFSIPEITVTRDKGSQQLLDFIDIEYRDPNLSLEYLASKLGMNRNKINRILKKETKLTYSVYINKVRLTKASLILASTVNTPTSTKPKNGDET